ncbi:MAG: phosphatase PAP2 family protein [Anaeromyxobacteraceae bacterium]
MTPYAAFALSSLAGMPPLFAHDPLDAVQRATHPGWWLALATALSVACEHWVLALLALATYAWMERDVASVLRTFVPLALALGVGIVIVATFGRIGALAGWGVRGVPSGHALWGATFAAYTVMVYRTRWAYLAIALPLAGGLGRIYLGSNGIPSVAAGWGVGALLGAAAFEIAARLTRLSKVA